MGFPTMWYMRPAKPQISLRIRSSFAAAHFLFSSGGHFVWLSETVWAILVEGLIRDSWVQFWPDARKEISFRCVFYFRKGGHFLFGGAE